MKEKNKGLTGIIDVSGIFHYVRQQKASGHFIVELFKTLRNVVYNVGIDRIIIVEDFGASSYRKELYPDYKGNRDKREYTKEQKDRLDLMYDWMAQLDEFKAFFPSIRVKNVEADDIIMLLYKQLTSEGQDCIVISQDKDYITGIDIKHLYDWKAQEFFSLEKKAKGLKPNKFKMLQGYIGDHIDHIPSICGEKTALILIDNFKTFTDARKFDGDISTLRGITPYTKHHVEKALLKLKDDEVWKQLKLNYELISIFTDTTNLNEKQKLDYEKGLQYIKEWQPSKFELSDEFELKLWEMGDMNIINEIEWGIGL